MYLYHNNQSCIEREHFFCFPTSTKNNYYTANTYKNLNKSLKNSNFCTMTLRRRKNSLLSTLCYISFTPHFNCTLLKLITYLKILYFKLKGIREYFYKMLTNSLRTFIQLIMLCVYLMKFKYFQIL